MGSFDQFMDDSSKKAPTKPFWALDFTDEDELLRWLNENTDQLKQQAQERVTNQRKNLAVFRGIQWQTQDMRTREEAADHNAPAKRAKNPRVIYNHMVDMVEQDVSRLTKYRGAVSASPASEDNADRIAAEVVEELVEGFWDKIEIDALMQKHSRRRRLLGEDFIVCVWNKNLGPYDLDWVAEVFKKAGIAGDPRKMSRAEIRQTFREKLPEIPRIEILDPETGVQMKGRDGKGLFIDRPMRKGDVDYRLVLSTDMLLQRQDDYAKVEYGQFRERVPTETLRAMHPSKAHKIESDPNYTSFDLDICEEVKRTDEVETWHLYCRSTDLLDQGRYIKFCRTAILINRPNPNIGWDDRSILPWVRTIDIDVPGSLNGDSTVTHGRGPQAVYNNLVSLKVRNRFLFSHPKWFYPQGSVDKTSLSNQSTLVSYKGAVPPTLGQAAINEANESQQLQEAKGDLQQIMGVYGVSRGDPPKGITAMVALQLLDEQESERANIGVQNHTRSLKELALMTVWLMADHYGDDPERLESLLGRNRAAQLKDFPLSDLRNIGDLRIENASALPQQKAARTQAIIDIRKEIPGLISDDVAGDLLGLGDERKLRSIISVAIKKAEGENDLIMRGSDAPAPLEVEYHLAHYRIHTRQMNEVAYGSLPKEGQERFKAHVQAHEMFLWKAGLKNPEFATLVLREFPAFPVFFVPEDPAIAEEAAAETLPMADAGMAPPELPPEMPLAAPAPIPPGAGLDTPPPEQIAPGQEALTPGAV